VTEYLIWSNEHRGWWKPRKAGYTPFIEEAGRWPEGEARTIVARCTLGGRLAYAKFNEQTRETYTALSEYAVPAPEVWETTVVAQCSCVEVRRAPGEVTHNITGCPVHDPEVGETTVVVDPLPGPLPGMSGEGTGDGLIYERATLPDGTLGQAVFNADRRYRYSLGRRWATGAETLVWVMLNPSTAGAHEDDATIRKCVGYAKRWGYSAMTVVNLFALIATNPVDLIQEPWPIGVDNNRILRDAFRPTPDGPPSDVMVAWGDFGHLAYRDLAGQAVYRHPPFPEPDRSVIFRDVVVGRLLDAAGCRPFCIGTTRRGQPKHPGRTAYALERVLWERPS
jgi:hypothetical protein